MAFTPTQADWIAANRLWQRRNVAFRWLRWVIVAVWTLLAATLAFDLLVLAMTVGEALSEEAIFIPAVIAMTIVPVINRFAVPRQVRRQFAQRPAMADPVRYVWNDDGVHADTRTGTTMFGWAELHRQLRDDTSVVFLLTDQMMLLIPTRVLTPDQAIDLADTADRYGPTLG